MHLMWCQFEISHVPGKYLTILLSELHPLSQMQKTGSYRAKLKRAALEVYCLSACEISCPLTKSANLSSAQAMAKASFTICASLCSVDVITLRM